MQRNILLFILALAFLGGGNSVYGKEEWAPDFIIVGVQKSATGSLRKYINQHPQVVWAKQSEVHFFDKNFAKGLQWYKDYFPKRPSSHHLLGEKTPAYMPNPQVPERLFSLFPKTKIIMILRNPVSRAYSHYQFNIARKAEHLSFEEAIDAEPKRTDGEERKLRRDSSYISRTFMRYSYLNLGIYVDQIKRWYAYFPKEQILILTLDDLAKDPQRVVNEIFAFLELPPCDNIQFGNSKETYYEPMKPETRQRLVEYFRPYNQQLRELLNRDFAWDK
jgi:hypothetical protein